MDCSLQGSSIHGIFQARILEWVAISFSKASSQPWVSTWVSRISGRRFTIWATKEAHESCSIVSDSLRPHGLYSPWNSPGQKTGVGSLSLLQGIFPTQGSNPGLPHCTWILYQLSHKGSPKGVLPPHWGVEPRSPTWPAGILTTVLTRTAKGCAYPSSNLWRLYLGV